MQMIDLKISNNRKENISLTEDARLFISFPFKYFQIFSIWTNYPTADAICGEKIDNSIYLIYSRISSIGQNKISLFFAKKHWEKMLSTTIVAIWWWVLKLGKIQIIRPSVCPFICPFVLLFLDKKANTEEVSNLKLRKVRREELLEFFFFFWGPNCLNVESHDPKSEKILLKKSR